MKILCPTDFSSAGNSGVEFAASIARALNASLDLMYVQPMHVTEGVTMFTGRELPSVLESKEVEKKLKDISQYTAKEFSISCDYIIDFSLSSFENKVSETSRNFDFIVIGTNGAETLNQFYNGSHSYKLAKLATCPVLIVPDGCNYTKFEKVVYATGYRKNDELLMGQLKDFLDIFKPDLIFTHVSLNDSPADKELYGSYCRIADEKLGYNGSISFDRISDNDPCNAIVKHLDKVKADVLVLCMEKHDFIYRLFHENLIKNMTAYDSGYPILVVHK